MVKVRSDYVERYVRNSSRTFLDGGQNVKWITRTLLRSGLSKQETSPILDLLRNHGDPSRAQALFSWFDSADW